jgi:hypothetical protein
LTELLLGFLGVPDEKLSIAYQTEPKKKQDKDQDEDEEDYDDLDDEVEEDADDENNVKEKEPPDDARLRKWVRAYVRCFDLKKATTKHAVETATEKFGVDMFDKKERIKELIAEEM